MLILDRWAFGYCLTTAQLEDWCSYYTRLPVEEVRSRGPLLDVAFDCLKQRDWLCYADVISLRSVDKGGKPLYMLMTAFKVTKRMKGDPKLRPKPIASKDSEIAGKVLPLEKLRKRNRQVWKALSFGVCEWPYEGIYSSAAIYYLYKTVQDYYPDDREQRAIGRQRLNQLLGIVPFHDEELNIVRNVAV